MPIPKPLALSDRQLEIVFTAAEPLFFDDRPAFLREVAAALGSPFRLSDDSVARVCTAVQSRLEWLVVPLAIDERAYTEVAFAACGVAEDCVEECL
jgi:hypothetical protein